MSDAQQSAEHNAMGWKLASYYLSQLVVARSDAQIQVRAAQSAWKQAERLQELVDSYQRETNSLLVDLDEATERIEVLEERCFWCGLSLLVLFAILGILLSAARFV